MGDSPDNIVPITPDARTAAEKFSEEHQRELLTILFTDLVDSTKLQSDAGNVEAARLTELHRKIVREELAKYDAREIEWAGDSCLAVFTKPSDAVVFALRMQAEHRRAREAEPKLPTVRVGIHLGEVLVKKREDGGKKTEDLFGLQVSEAARIMTVARGNQILCTRAVFDNARSALKGATVKEVGEVRWIKHGLFMLKGSEDPVELFEVGSSDVASFKAPTPSEKVVPVSGVPAVQSRRNLQLAAIVAVFLITVFFATYQFSSRQSNVVAPSETESSAEASVSDEAKVVRRSRLGVSLPPAQQNVTITPNGDTLVYLTRPQADVPRTTLAIQQIGELSSEMIPDTLNASNPFISPDGKHVGYFDESERRLMRVPLSGGTPLEIGEATLPWGTEWGDDGIYFGAFGSTITHMDTSNGHTKHLTEKGVLKGGGHIVPSFLPEGKGMLFTIVLGPPFNSSTYLLKKDGDPEIFIPEGREGRYVPTGHVVYFKDRIPMVARVDLETLKVELPGVQLKDDEGLTSNYSFSKDGTMVYLAATDRATQGTRSLAWVDLEGNSTPLATPVKNYLRVRISPDGNRALISADRDIWTHELGGAVLEQRTFLDFNDFAAEFIEDGTTIAFSSDRTGRSNIHTLPAVASAIQSEPYHLIGSPYPQFPEAWDAERRRLVYAQLAPETNMDIGVAMFPEQGDQWSQIVYQTDGNEGATSISPDGNWIVFTSTETGQAHIYLAKYPSFEEKRQISVSPQSSEPVWARDGSAIYYRTYPAMKRVTLELDEEIAIGRPEELWRNPAMLANPSGERMYDIHPDGRRFLMVTILPENRDRDLYELVVVENWFEELKRLAPHPQAN